MSVSFLLIVWSEVIFNTDGVTIILRIIKMKNVFVHYLFENNHYIIDLAWQIEELSEWVGFIEFVFENNLNITDLAG